MDFTEQKTAPSRGCWLLASCGSRVVWLGRTCLYPAERKGRPLTSSYTYLPEHEVKALVVSGVAYRKLFFCLLFWHLPTSLLQPATR